MRRLVFAALIACSIAGPATAQASPDAQIVVSGEATAERPAEWVVLSLEVHGEGKTEVEALKAMTLMRARIENELPRLKDIGAVRIETSELKVQQVRSKACGDGEPYDRKPVLSEGPCV